MALFQFPPSKLNFEKSIKRCHNAMKIGVVNKSTILIRFVIDTSQRNITHLAVITRKSNIKLGILKGELEKSQNFKGLTMRTNYICLSIISLHADLITIGNYFPLTHFSQYQFLCLFCALLKLNA